jgi:hypothetical protein
LDESLETFDSVIKKKASQRINCGAGRQADGKFVLLEKNPENKIVFGAYKQTKPHKSVG